MLAGGSILPRGRGRPASLVQERRRVSCTLEAKCAVDRRVASRVKLTESRFREKMGGRGGEEGGGSNAEPVNFSASNDFPAVEVLAELANASRLSNLSLSLSISGERTV